jgi:hypothetical protein
MILSGSRRKFIKSSSAIILGSPMLNLPIACKTKSAQDTSLDIHIFSKHLQFLNYRDMADAARTLGFDGIDLTV